MVIVEKSYSLIIQWQNQQQFIDVGIETKNTDKNDEEIDSKNTNKNDEEIEEIDTS